MFKRIGLMFLVGLMISITVSFIASILGIGRYIGPAGLNYGALMALCLLWGFVGSFVSLMISKWMAKSMMGVQIVTENGPHKDLVQTVHRLSLRAGLKEMPEVGIYQGEELNAFATGPSRNNSLVAVSTGLLTHMNDHEVEGVLAHEVAHIANGDMVTMALVSGIMNAFVMFLARVLGFFIANAMRGNNDDRDEAPNPIVYHIVVFVLDMILGVLASIVVAWFSRYREFKADKGGAQLAGKEKMIAALSALNRFYSKMESENSRQEPAMQAMQISSKRSVLSLFSTHPPLEERINALRSQL